MVTVGHLLLIIFRVSRKQMSLKISVLPDLYLTANIKDSNNVTVQLNNNDLMVIALVS